MSTAAPRRAHGIEISRSTAAMRAGAQLVAPVETTSAVDVLRRVLRRPGSFRHTVVGDQVMSCPADGAGHHRPLDGAMIFDWLANHYALPGDRPTRAQCDEIAAGIRADLIAERAAALAAQSPADAAVAAEHARRARAARRAELERQQAAAAAELAALGDGASEPVAPAVEAPRRGRFGQRSAST